MIRALLLGSAAALATTAALAADLPRREAPPVAFAPVPVFTWTGFYAGLHTGYAFTDNPNIQTRGNDPFTGANVVLGRRAASIKSEVDGFSRIGGGFGYNVQFTPGSGFVAGIAFDATWLDLDKRTGFYGTPNPAVGNASVYTQDLDFLGTVNGKLGYAFDRFFVYGTGGLAFGHVSYGADFYNPGATLLQYTGGGRKIFETGYNYGGGIEYAIPADSFLTYFSLGRYLGIKSDVTIKAEYIRYDLGSRNVLVGSVPGGPGGSYTSRFSTEGSLIRAGFNYKFGGL